MSKKTREQIYTVGLTIIITIGILITLTGFCTGPASVAGINPETPATARLTTSISASVYQP